jgi:hypothetical protein
MPCVAILRDRFYDIIVRDNNLESLYYFGAQMDASGENEAPLDEQQFAIAHEFWITSDCVIFENEADFFNRFPNREIPMCLTMREAASMNWEDGIVRAGIIYFGNKALRHNPNQELVWPDRHQDEIKNFNILKNFMNIVAEQQHQ